MWFSFTNFCGNSLTEYIFYGDQKVINSIMFFVRMLLQKGREWKGGTSSTHGRPCGLLKDTQVTEHSDPLIIVPFSFIGGRMQSFSIGFCSLVLFVNRGTAMLTERAFDQLAQNGGKLASC